jgi:hypothetical protein
VREPLLVCPKRFVTADVWRLFRSARLLKMNAGWPGGRGWMHETCHVVKGVYRCMQLLQMDEE